jgi:hypothetical protein
MGGPAQGGCCLLTVWALVVGVFWIAGGITLILNSDWNGVGQLVGALITAIGALYLMN